MKTHLFDPFRRMIETIPVNGVLLAAKLERRMIEDDLSRMRVAPSEETLSVFNFCRFLQAAAAGNGIFPTTLPSPHLGFYRQTVARLVEAGELPGNAAELFDRTFLPGILKNQWLFNLNAAGASPAPGLT